MFPARVAAHATLIQRWREEAQETETEIEPPSTRRSPRDSS